MQTPYRYRKIPSTGKCYYCGAPATEWDHCPPVTGAHLYLGRYEFVKVHSCRECNAKLSDTSLPTLSERARYLGQKRLNTKKTKVPKTVEFKGPPNYDRRKWTEDEKLQRRLFNLSLKADSL